MQPLTPPDANLQDWPKMMIHIARLRGSTFDAVVDAEAWRAGVNLWLTSWHNTPAGSLDDSDTVLAKAAELGRDLKTWRRVKGEAMRGWVLCDDGRWYHPVVAEVVLEAWIGKLLKRISSGHGNLKKYGIPFDREVLIRDVRTAADMLERLDPKSEVLRKPAVAKARAGLPMGEDFVPVGRESVPVGTRRDRKGREGKIPPIAPQGASVEIDWEGPAKIRDLVRSAGLAGYLGYFTWRDVPEKALVTSSPTMHAKLKPLAGELQRAGAKLLLEKGRAA